jgi:mono/diheme cytochrome c family protein
MRRILKYAGVLAGAIALLAIVGVAGLYAWTSNELAAKSPLPGHAFTAPTDSASVVRGEHVVRAIGKCGDCHGQDLGGDTLLDDPAMGLIYSPNLTRGAGGIGGTYTDAQWEAAIRHGLAADGRRLVVMPSNEYQFLSDEDLGTIIAYLRTVPAVDRTGPTQRVGPLARALYAGGVFPMFPAKAVTHGDEVVAGGGDRLDRDVRQVPRRRRLQRVPRCHVWGRRDPREARRTGRSRPTSRRPGSATTRRRASSPRCGPASGPTAPRSIPSCRSRRRDR